MSNSTVPEPSTERVTRSTAARRPRRRARESDSDTLKTQAPRRKRSKITEDTYAPRKSTENGSVSKAPSQEGEVVGVEPTTNGMNGHAHATSHHTNGFSRHEHISTPMIDAETSLAIRSGKKGTVKRSHLRGDGATTLCHNEAYSVKMLPSTPKELKKEGVEYRGSIQGTHALAVTEKKAIIWEYTSHAVASNPRTFDIPFPARPAEPLPFGALVPSGISTSDLGLLLISATGGRVVFYESTDCATSMGTLFDRRTGVEGTVPLSYETVTSLTFADHAGFIVTLSSGKLVHLTLRDAQGKPRIACQQLKIVEPGSGGVFGSFTGFLKSTHRKDLTAVHTRPSSTRGRMQAIGLTERGELLLWDLDWSGRSDFQATFDFREMLLDALRTQISGEAHGALEHLATLDFAITAKPSAGTEVARIRDTEQALSLVLLLRTGTSDTHRYHLADINLPGNGSVDITRVDQLDTYSPPSFAQNKPRLIIPRPGHTAFVAFEDATTLVGLNQFVPETPDAQLTGAQEKTQSFEGTINLRTDKGLVIQEVYEEQHKGGQTSVVAFIKSAGLVRFSSFDTTGIPDIAVKSKIEQAVFYGALQQDNIIDFTKQTESGYALEDVEDSALQISDEILCTKTGFTHFIPTSPSSMPQHLATRAKALEALATHVRRNHAEVSRSTMWRLLWDAERIAAGQQLWVAFQEHITLVSQVKRKATLLDELCAWFEVNNEPFTVRKELANEDDVRRFFLGGLHHLEKLLQHLRHFLKGQQEETELNPAALVKVVLQANEICLLSLQTAYKFRTDHCASYGFSRELIEDGLLIAADDYMDVPEFWTSPQWLVANTVDIANFSGEINKKLYESDSLDVDTERMAREVAETNPQLLELWCTQYQESINWNSGQPDPRHQDRAEKLADAFRNERYIQLRKLADLGQAYPGMHLAEKYRDMHTLTDMVIAEDQFLEEGIKDRSADRSGVESLRKDLQSRIRQYFSRYGELWSNEFFNKLFSSGSSGPNLVRAQIEWKQPLTEYLRAHPSRAKLCWINDVTEMGDFANAASVLRNAAEEQETKLWSKKVELSMAKLALLAAKEDAEGVTSMTRLPSNTQEKAATTQDDLTIVRVQEELYAHLRPDILASIDREAELLVCMQTYGTKTQGYEAFRQLLERDLDLVLNANALSVEQLIDVLTLMDVRWDDKEDNFRGAEFFKALTVLNAAASMLPATRFEMLLQLIWKRAYLDDNWRKIKFTSKTSDQERLTRIRQTSTWHTIHYFFESKFANDSNAHIRIVLPSECLGSACSAEDWVHRFPSPEEEDVLMLIVQDATQQDELLQSHVDDRHLDQVATECVEDVKALKETKRAEEYDMAAQETHLKDDDDVDEHTNGHPIGYQDFDEDELGVAGESGVEEEESGIEAEGEEGDQDVEMGQ